MKPWLGLVVAVLGLVSVGCQPKNLRVSTLWTNVPEVPEYVEQFNASQSQWQILVAYQTDPAHELLTPGIKADLVISRDLDSRALRSTWTSLEFLFERGGVTKADFYPQLLGLGSDGGTPLLLPLSFDLPIIVFKKGSVSDPDGLYFSFKYLERTSHAWNLATPTGFHRFAFSPRWDGFADVALPALGASFGEDLSGHLSWDASNLDSTLAQLKSWIRGKDDGVEERDFTQKYANSNPLELLENGRELFAATTLKTFLKLPEDERAGLEFRYLNAGLGVPVESDIVWAGIPASAQTRSAAQAFLSWYFQQTTQAQLIHHSFHEDLRGFGVADGLDSLISLNVTELPSYYPELATRLPPVKDLLFPQPLPSEWPALRAKVIDPWLDKTLSGQTADNLSALVDRWYRETAPH